MTTTDEDKKKYLEYVNPDNYFVFSNGLTARNLEELYAAINNSEYSIFSEYVSEQKNDFALWIRDCVSYGDLFNKLVDLRKKEDFLNALKLEIDALKTINAVSVEQQSIQQTQQQIPIQQEIQQSASIEQPVQQQTQSPTQPIIQSPPQEIPQQTQFSSTPQTLPDSSSDLSAIDAELTADLSSEILGNMDSDTDIDSFQLQGQNSTAQDVANQTIQPTQTAVTVQSQPAINQQTIIDQSSYFQQQTQQQFQQTQQQFQQQNVQPDKMVQTVQIGQNPPEQLFEFEEVFKAEVDELNKEIFKD